jgi:Fe2+ transport system protein FeoA
MSAHAPTHCHSPFHSLADLRPDEEAIIVDVDLCSEGCARLCELGLAPGVNVTMLCPGRTSLVKAGRSRLSVRTDELRAILVERLTS